MKRTRTKSNVGVIDSRQSDSLQDWSNIIAGNGLACNDNQNGHVLAFRMEGTLRDLCNAVQYICIATDIDSRAKRTEAVIRMFREVYRVARLSSSVTPTQWIQLDVYKSILNNLDI